MVILPSDRDYRGQYSRARPGHLEWARRRPYCDPGVFDSHSRGHMAKD